MAIKEVDAQGNQKGALETHKPTIMLCLFSYGGVKGRTMWSLFQEMRLMDRLGVNFVLHTVDDDALISRSRSKALSAFMANTALDVCFMLDHDIEFEEGAILSTCTKAKMVQSCVSGFYSARAIGGGFSSRPKDEKGVAKAGEDTLVEAEYLAGGFLAIPRVVVEEVFARGKEAQAQLNDQLNTNGDFPTLANCALTPNLYSGKAPAYDFFRPICVPRTIETARIRPDLPSLKEVSHEYLSEDWAFSWRCAQANSARPLYLWSMPWLKHYGDYPYTMATAFVPRPVSASEDTVAVGNAPKVTLR